MKYRCPIPASQPPMSGVWVISMTNNQMCLLFSPHRQAWALVGVIDGGSSSCNESVRNYENHSTGGKALAQGEFYTLDGQKFSVTAYSEWIEGRQRSFKLCETQESTVTDGCRVSLCPNISLSVSVDLLACWS